MALICRIRFPEPVGDPEEWNRIFDGIRYSMPEVAASMLMSITEKRAEMRRRGVSVPAGLTSRDVPLVSIAHPRFQEAANRFALKLFSSLYYKHTRRILTPAGRIFFVWRTNVDSFDELLGHPSIASLLAHLPDLRRQNQALNDQFSYRYNVAEVDPPSAVFGVVFNHAVAMVGIVMGDIKHFNLPMPDEELLRPFVWPTPAD
ncbi:hypothetical protein [Burkholderia territorii]|uniref:hypothetical protein n=1 Tax=Burkholderia territorii TaxID=1503055 RepID=UPI0012D861CD|nr:hypothetical protein [Burkholderia territorii]